MTAIATDTRSIVVERQMAHPPEKIWRALTTSHLIAEWLMQYDFAPVEGHRFTFRATPLPGWSGVTNCVVLEIDPPRLLSYSWGDGTESDSGLKTVVTWTLTANGQGTHVRMEQSGFRPDQKQAFGGARHGWEQFFGNLEQVLARAA